jgi:uncharacterized protein with GYD domain
MIFLTLGKLPPDTTKRIFANIADGRVKIPENIKMIGMYSTIGEFDCAFLYSAKNEAEAQSFIVDVLRGLGIATETLLCTEFK